MMMIDMYSFIANVNLQTRTILRLKSRTQCNATLRYIRHRNALFQNAPKLSSERLSTGNRWRLPPVSHFTGLRVYASTFTSPHPITGKDDRFVESSLIESIRLIRGVDLGISSPAR